MWPQFGMRLPAACSPPVLPLRLIAGSTILEARALHPSLPSQQPLVMGFGYMFGLAEESIPAHIGERAPRLREGEQLAPAEQEEELEEQQGSAAGDGGNSGSDSDSDSEGEQGTSAAAPSALEAFMDASADMLASGSAAAAVRHGSSTGSGAAAAGTDSVTAAFARYGLADTLAAERPAALEEEEQAGGDAGEG